MQVAQGVENTVQSKFMAPQTVHKQFVSTTRDHVVDVMTRLAAALPETVLNDPDQPLMVGLNGQRNAGKSLVPFVFRDVLFDGAEQEIKGRKEFDELWTAKTADKDIEVGFVNLIWAFMDFSKSLKKDFPQGRKAEPHEVAEAFFNKREKGGVTFVSFADRGDVPQGLKIEITKNGILKDMAQTNTLTEEAVDLASKHSDTDWLRMIKIEVSDPRLLASKPFMQAVADIQAVYDHKAAPDSTPDSAPASAPAAAKRRSAPKM